MVELRYSAPLRWPANIPATPPAQRRFNTSFPGTLTIAEGVALLEEEIQALNPEKVMIYSDMDQLQVDRLRKKLGQQAGVCVEIRMDGRKYNLTCDQWTVVEQNLYALHLVLRNMRLMEKWGVATLPKLLQGFLDGPTFSSQASGNAEEEWMGILGLGPTATLEDAHAVYRRRAKAVMEDADALLQLNNAMDMARKKLRSE